MEESPHIASQSGLSAATPRLIALHGVYDTGKFFDEVATEDEDEDLGFLLSLCERR